MSHRIDLKNGEFVLDDHTMAELAGVVRSRGVDTIPSAAGRPGPALVSIGAASSAASATVSGTYRGQKAGYELELRIDVDGTRACQLVSADFYRLAGGVKTHYGSQKSGPVTVTASTVAVTIEGSFFSTFASSYTLFKVTIPKTGAPNRHGAATITYSDASGAQGRTYVCAFDDAYFRTVELETDFEDGTTLFGNYNTGALAHGGAARTLDVVCAYAEAGIRIVPTAGSDAVPTAAAGADAVWTNAELEAAMHQHFSLVSDSPCWQTYLLACTSRHEMTTGGTILFGIMFDYVGSVQRQGCAVFQSQIDAVNGGAARAEAHRHSLYCYVHEIGHSFNLLHSWDKGRPDALSWMNYPDKYDARNGAGRYWSNFAFEFDALELAHLRHDFRNSVIMGGDNWDTNPGAGIGELPLDITHPVVENGSGLMLEVQAKPAFALGEPVVVALRLSVEKGSTKHVDARLHPNFGFVKVLIRKPSGAVVAYEPLAEHLARPHQMTLDTTTPSITESVYVGYGRGGHYFDQPGTYLLRAAYHTPEGGVIVSSDVKMRVKSPLSKADDTIADLYLGDQQGRLFYLLGSDAPHLDKGNHALTKVLKEHDKHPLSVYAALVKGVNAARAFKHVKRDKTVTVRPAEPQRAGELIDKVFRMTKAGTGIDRITLSYAMRTVAATQLKEGDEVKGRERLAALRAYVGQQPLALHDMDHEQNRIDAMVRQQ